MDEVYQLFPFPIPKAELMACKFNNDSNLIGALYNYLEHFHPSELNELNEDHKSFLQDKQDKTERYRK